jgi:hypothetical protein
MTIHPSMVPLPCSARSFPPLLLGARRLRARQNSWAYGRLRYHASGSSLRIAQWLEKSLGSYGLWKRWLVSQRPVGSQRLFSFEPCKIWASGELMWSDVNDPIDHCRNCILYIYIFIIYIILHKSYYLVFYCITLILYYFWLCNILILYYFVILEYIVYYIIYTTLYIILFYMLYIYIIYVMTMCIRSCLPTLCWQFLSRSEAQSNPIGRVRGL